MTRFHVKWMKSEVRQAYTSAGNSQFMFASEVRATATSWAVFNSARVPELAYWNNETTFTSF